MFNPVLAKRLKMARCGADLSRDELADAVSAKVGYRISGELLRRIEVGERDIELGMIVAISQVTGEPIAWLTDGAIPGSLQIGDDLRLFPAEYLNSEPAEVLAIAG